MNGRIFLGVDGGSEFHVCLAVDEDGCEVWKGRIANNHSGCETVLEQVQQWQKAGYEVWAGAEGIGGWLSPLDKRLCLQGVWYVNIHSKQFSCFKEMEAVQPDGDDERDAWLLAELLKRQVEKGQARCEDRAEEYFETLKTISREFETLSREKSRLQLQLVGMVRRYWPELVEKGRYFSRTDSPSLLGLLMKYADPESIARAGKCHVRQAMKRGSGRNRQTLADRLVEEARSLRETATVSPSLARIVQTKARRLLEMRKDLRCLEHDLKEQLEQHPFGEWMLAQDGIGVRTAGGFLGEAGNLDRFEKEPRLARYAGNGANHSQSGKSKDHHFDGRRYNHHLKRVVMLMAEARSQHHQESRDYLWKRKRTSQDHWITIKKLARHLIRFLWKGWQQVVHNRVEITLHSEVAT